MPTNPATILARQDNVERLQERLGVEWPAIAAARERSRETIARVHLKVRPIIPPDTSLVVFGSLARLEQTVGSDVDWTLLVDGQADATHMDTAARLQGRLREVKLADPTLGGAFGSITFSHDLVHRIGGDDDTNRTTTQRLLLILESLALGDRKAHDRVVTRILTRYVEEDRRGPADSPYHVPRFLQNDVARYWRTIAVDFAHKRRTRGDGWALRTAKLRMSRKLIYAAGLIACYSCHFAFPPHRRAHDPWAGEQAVVSHLVRLVQTTPLDIMAGVALLWFGKTSVQAAQLFRAYDEFLRLMNDPEWRKDLKKLKPERADADAGYQKVKALGTEFQDALTELFLLRATPVRDLTRHYGVF